MDRLDMNDADLAELRESLTQNYLDRYEEIPWEYLDDVEQEDRQEDAQEKRERRDATFLTTMYTLDGICFSLTLISALLVGYKTKGCFRILLLLKAGAITVSFVGELLTNLFVVGDFPDQFTTTNGNDYFVKHGNVVSISLLFSNMLMNIDVLISAMMMREIYLLVCLLQVQEFCVSQLCQRYGPWCCISAVKDVFVLIYYYYFHGSTIELEDTWRKTAFRFSNLIFSVIVATPMVYWCIQILMKLANSLTFRRQANVSNGDNKQLHKLQMLVSWIMCIRLLGVIQSIVMIAVVGPKSSWVCLLNQWEANTPLEKLDCGDHAESTYWFQLSERSIISMCFASVDLLGSVILKIF